jgi:hypothetical protein
LDAHGYACSEDVLRVIPDTNKIRPGYLYAFLQSKLGTPMVTAGTYGGAVPHIEPEHLKDLLVPRFGPSLEDKTHDLVSRGAVLISEYQQAIHQATEQFFASVGLREITNAEWHAWGRDLGFKTSFPCVKSLRPLNFAPRFLRLCERIKRGPWQPLGELCKPGTLKRGDRFSRIDAHPDHARKLISQRQLFWLRPRGRWISRGALRRDAVVKPGTILIAARGTLGEQELYCRAEFVWGPWTNFAYSEDILRVDASEEKVLPGCLFAFFRSETAFRLLRGVSTGTKLQDHQPGLLRELPIPLPPRPEQEAIHNLIIDAYEKRHEAVALEDQAVRMVEEAIEAGGA